MNSSKLSLPLLSAGRILRDVHLTRTAPISRSATALQLKESAAAVVNPSHAEAKTQAENAYRRGVHDGKAAEHAALRDLLKVLQSATASLEASRADVQRQLDEQVLALSFAIARKVISHEMRHADGVRAAIEKALTQLPARAAARIRIHPMDMAVLEAWRQDVKTEGLPEDLVFQPDASVGRGGCIVESPLGCVDARIETQLKLIEEALLALGGTGGCNVASKPK